MSEYQYYEFQAIDRPLTKKEMLELRAYSTRARITPTSFINEYHWGDLKGSPDRWMEKYFDAFLYLANWGTRIFKLRVAAQLLDLETAKQFCASENLRAWEKGGFVILSFESDQDPDDEWVEPEGSLSSLIPLRSDLMRGDHRSLYLGWLLCAQNGELDDEDLEPPVPPGLKDLNASLTSLAEFIRIDPPLLAAAAQASRSLEHVRPKRDEIRAWLARLPAGEKDDLLARVVEGEDLSLAGTLLQRFVKERNAGGRQSAEMPERRTVGELLGGAEELRRIAARKAAEAQARKKRKAAITRAKYHDEIAEREPELWNEIGSLIATRQPKSYDQAVKLLADLRDLATRKEKTEEFGVKINELTRMHAQKQAFLRRLRKTGL
jgi:hypothetical protein